MSIDTDLIVERVELAHVGRPITEVKNNLTSIVADLGDEPVYINVRGVPRAAIVQIGQLLDMATKAEAYELMQIADEAEQGKKLTLSELHTFLDQRSNQRMVTRESKGGAE